MSMLRRVRFQPDYFMSAQFAGLAVAHTSGLYKRRGVELEVLPVGRAGEHADEISIVSRGATGALTVGSTEQNILIPAQREGAAVQAVAAMFGRSPLALAALPGHAPWSLAGDAAKPARIGVHEDTVGLLERLMPSAEVVPVGRVEKLALLRAGEVDAVQVYDVMETMKMEHDLGGTPPDVLPLEGVGGARLGYAQVLFASDEALRDPARRELLRDFLAASFEGWQEAGRDPHAAAEAVRRLMELHPDGASGSSGGCDHWVDEAAFHAASVARCCDYVRRARCAGTLGAIDHRRWAEASEWLGGSGGRPSLDASVWGADPLLVDGDSLAARLIEGVGASAAALASPPRLGLVTVGELAEGHTSGGAAARASIAPSGRSWFDKAEAGRRSGVAVEQLDLPHDTTTPQLVATLRRLARRCDGIQLMWPLPPHIDAAAAYGAVPEAIDVDGAHFVGLGEMRRQRRSCSGEDRADAQPAGTVGGGVGGVGGGGWMPVTPEAVMTLLAHRGVPLKGRSAVVIGRSRIVGSPLAHALLAADATVTVAHSRTPPAELAALCRAADVIVSGAGVPGLVTGDMVKPGAAVVSVGTSFCGDGDGASLRSDLEPDLDAFRHAACVVSAPGGVGPLSLALLLRNVVASAASARGRTAATAAAAAVESDTLAGGADADTPPAATDALAAFAARHPHWRLLPATQLGAEVAAVDAAEGLVAPARALVRTLQLPSHADAASLLRRAGDAGDARHHHVAHAAVEHRCTHGVRVTLHAYTTATGDVTAHDLELAREIDELARQITDGDDATAAEPPPTTTPPTTPPAPPVPPSVQQQATAKFRYELPPELVAVHPAKPRGASRLLVHVPATPSAPQFGRDLQAAAAAAATATPLASGGGAFDFGFAQLPQLLPSYAHLVFNQSRVFAARVHATALGGVDHGGGGGSGGIEVLFLSPLSSADPAAALASPAAGQLWKAMVRAPLSGGGARLAVEGGPASPSPSLRLHLEVEEVLAPWIEEGETDGVEAAVRLSLAPPPSAAPMATPTTPPPPLAQLLGVLGEVPLPPYLRREALPSDGDDYQTVYAAAAQTGSVAAPTAGLHFTPEVLAALAANGVRSSSLALHVGAGTFKPVSAATLGGHEMHAEPFAIDAACLAALATSAAEGRPIVPVGTTSARVLESAYWLGVAAADAAEARGGGGGGGALGGCGDGESLGHLGQWDAYRLHAAAATRRSRRSRVEVLEALRARADAAGGRLDGSTSLCIAPGYPFAMCDGIVTNFHAPDSTLMTLLSALVGGAPQAHELYAHAIARRYRFLSYGDSSLIARAAPPPDESA